MEVRDVAACVSAGSPPAGPTRFVEPFVVTGWVHGRDVAVMAASLSDVVSHIARWTATDPDAFGCWSLRDDYSEPLHIVVRHRRGRVREARRSAHVVRLLPGAARGALLVTLCGERLTILDAEALPVGAGMPCAPCVAEASEGLNG
jgi:hypothetical protein